MPKEFCPASIANLMTRLAEHTLCTPYSKGRIHPKAKKAINWRIAVCSTLPNIPQPHTSASCVRAAYSAPTYNTSILADIPIRLFPAYIRLRVCLPVIYPTTRNG